MYEHLNNHDQEMMVEGVTEKNRILDSNMQKFADICEINADVKQPPANGQEADGKSFAGRYSSDVMQVLMYVAFKKQCSLSEAAAMANSQDPDVTDGIRRYSAEYLNKRLEDDVELGNPDDPFAADIVKHSQLLGQNTLDKFNHAGPLDQIRFADDLLLLFNAAEVIKKTAPMDKDWKDLHMDNQLDIPETFFARISDFSRQKNTSQKTYEDIAGQHDKESQAVNEAGEKVQNPLISLNIKETPDPRYTAAENQTALYDNNIRTVLDCENGNKAQQKIGADDFDLLFINGNSVNSIFKGKPASQEDKKAYFIHAAQNPENKLDVLKLSEKDGQLKGEFWILAANGIEGMADARKEDRFSKSAPDGIFHAAQVFRDRMIKINEFQRSQGNAAEEMSAASKEIVASVTGRHHDSTSARNQRAFTDKLKKWGDISDDRILLQNAEEIREGMKMVRGLDDFSRQHPDWNFDKADKFGMICSLANERLDFLQGRQPETGITSTENAVRQNYIRKTLDIECKNPEKKVNFTPGKSILENIKDKLDDIGQKAKENTRSMDLDLMESGSYKARITADVLGQIRKGAGGFAPMSEVRYLREAYADAEKNIKSASETIVYSASGKTQKDSINPDDLRKLIDKPGPEDLAAGAARTRLSYGADLYNKSLGINFAEGTAEKGLLKLAGKDQFDCIFINGRSVNDLWIEQKEKYAFDDNMKALLKSDGYRESMIVAAGLKGTNNITFTKPFDKTDPETGAHQIQFEAPRPVHRTMDPANPIPEPYKRTAFKYHFIHEKTNEEKFAQAIGNEKNALKDKQLLSSIDALNSAAGQKTMDEETIRKAVSDEKIKGGPAFIAEGIKSRAAGPRVISLENLSKSVNKDAGKTKESAKPAIARTEAKKEQKKEEKKQRGL